MNAVLDKILNDAKNKYVNFKHPSYAFIDVTMLSYFDLYKNLMAGYNVTDDTDLNCDVCLHYYLEKDGDNWEVCVSLVGYYAMITKQIDERKWKVLESADTNSELDRTLFAILTKCGFQVLDMTTLKTKVDFMIEGSNGEYRDYAYIYEILFYHSPLRFLGDCD
jgi:aminopeptidase C